MSYWQLLVGWVICSCTLLKYSLLCPGCCYLDLLIPQSSVCLLLSFSFSVVPSIYLPSFCSLAFSVSKKPHPASVPLHVTINVMSCITYIFRVSLKCRRYRHIINLAPCLKAIDTFYGDIWHAVFAVLLDQSAVAVAVCLETVQAGHGSSAVSFSVTCLQATPAFDRIYGARTDICSDNSAIYDMVSTLLTTFTIPLRVSR